MSPTEGPSAATRPRPPRTGGVVGWRGPRAGGLGWPRPPRKPLPLLGLHPAAYPVAVKGSDQTPAPSAHLGLGQGDIWGIVTLIISPILAFRALPSSFSHRFLFIRRCCSCFPGPLAPGKVLPFMVHLKCPLRKSFQSLPLPASKLS